MGQSSAPPDRDSAPDSLDRRSSERFDVTWAVDCETEDTFLYASIGNISEMGIFVQTTEPLPIGTTVTLRFASPEPPPGESLSEAEPPNGGFVLQGVVQWINPVRALADNPNPGMGVRFTRLTADDRERIVELVRTIAYLRDDLASKTN